MIRRIFLIAALSAALVWAADWLVLRFRSEPYDQVEVRHRYAVQLRNKQIEQMSDKPQLEDCVRSLFPHDGDSPCWYLRRHAETRETLDGRPWHFWKQ